VLCSNLNILSVTCCFLPTNIKILKGSKVPIAELQLDFPIGSIRMIGLVFEG
jgi:hypothetical protein